MFNKQKEFNFFKSRKKHSTFPLTFDFFAPKEPCEFKPENEFKTPFFLGVKKVMNKYVNLYIQAILISIFLHIAGFMSIDAQIAKMHTSDFNQIVISIACLVMMTDIGYFLLKSLFGKPAWGQLLATFSIYTIGVQYIGGVTNFVSLHQYLLEWFKPILG